MITFVGAGPGAEDLITVRGQNKLKEADVVIYAGSLVNPALLKMCREECEIYNSAEMTLEEAISTCKPCRKPTNVFATCCAIITVLSTNRTWLSLT